MSPELKAALVGAIVSAVGTLAGTFVGSKMAADQRAEERHIEQQKLVLEQRVKVLERTSVLANSRARVARLRQIVEDDAALREESSACATEAKKSGKSTLPCRKLYDLAATSHLHKEYVELHANYVSTMQLAKLHFGQKVIEAVDSLTQAPKNAPQRNWWDIPGPEYLAVIAAMRDEIRVSQGLPPPKPQVREERSSPG
ncbi:MULTISPECIES: hypothetical protein [unclassified Roseateles]|uniref:hypothetical protein n=1 Tax=unclassified Roseateles TaxID=2626991 RepID=UPI0012E3499E|nr:MULTISPECIES: hypothetical protein [unclassified Roseateles]